METGNHFTSAVSCATVLTIAFWSFYRRGVPTIDYYAGMTIGILSFSHDIGSSPLGYLGKIEEILIQWLIEQEAYEY
jgi:hypothetical protein